MIFAESLPSRDAVHGPVCSDIEKPEPAKNKDASQRDRSRPTTDLMVLNKQICQEIADVIYEERWFSIHVHEGLADGGVEFLQAGRQPLQFLYGTRDQRFEKFVKNDDFGFNRIKKIQIQIFQSEEEDCRHTAINTYLMNLALCRLLHRSGEADNRITSVRIEFMKPSSSARTGNTSGRRAILRKEHYWWDPDSSAPRATSIYNVPNVQLVLRPFAQLDSCHSVKIELPDSLAKHQETVNFVSELERSMMCRTPTVPFDDELEMNLERAQLAMEDYVKYIRAGKEREEMELLSIEEATEAGVWEEDDEWVEGTRPPKKHSRSVSHGDIVIEPDTKRRLSPKLGDEDATMRQYHWLLSSEYQDGLDEETAMRKAVAASYQDVIEARISLADDLAGESNSWPELMTLDTAPELRGPRRKVKPRKVVDLTGDDSDEEVAVKANRVRWTETVVELPQEQNDSRAGQSGPKSARLNALSSQPADAAQPSTQAPSQTFQARATGGRTLIDLTSPPTFSMPARAT